MGYRGTVSIPSLGGVTDGAKAAVKNLQNKDVLYGLVAGIAGAAAARIGANKLNAHLLSKPGGKGLPAWVATAAPAAGGVLGAAALYATKKGGSTGQTAALAVGVGLAGWAFLREKWLDKSGTPVLSDIVSLQLGDYGVMIDEPTPRRGLSGLLIDEPRRALQGYSDRPGLSDLAAVAMSEPSDYQDVEDFQTMIDAS